MPFVHAIVNCRMAPDQELVLDLDLVPELVPAPDLVSVSVPDLVLASVSVSASVPDLVPVVD